MRDTTDWAWPASWVPSGFVARIAPFGNPERFRDTRFIVVDRDGQPLLRGDAFVNPAGIGGPAAGPVRLVPAAGCDHWGDAIKPALTHLLALRTAFGGQVQVADLPAATPGLLSPVGTACLKLGGNAETQVFMDIDLTVPEEELWSHVRKSYRPLIRRAERRLRLSVLDRDHPDWSLMEHFRRLHYLHFPGAKADGFFFAEAEMRRMIAEGVMEVLVGFDGDRPVATLITADDGDTTHYYAARYLHDHGNNYGAWGIWQAILRAKSRGLRRFHLGYYDFVECQQSKMRNIAFYKAGFTEAYRYEQSWRV